MKLSSKSRQGKMTIYDYTTFVNFILAVNVLLYEQCQQHSIFSNGHFVSDKFKNDTGFYC